MLAHALLYIPIFASCLALCLGLTLLLVGGIPDLLTAELRVRLLQLSTFTGVFCLLCTAQWIYALCLVVFVFSKAYRAWLARPTNHSLNQATVYLMAGGGFGLVDLLGWLDFAFGWLKRWLAHPVLAVGLILLLLIVLVMAALRGAGNAGDAA